MYQRRQFFGLNVTNVGDALIDQIRFLLVQIDAGNIKTSLCEFDRQRKADVTQTHDADRAAGFDLFREKGSGGISIGVITVLMLWQLSHDDMCLLQ